MRTADRPRILCVDDEPLVLAGLADALHREFDVTTAEGGLRGLHVLSDLGPFAVVVSDFSMPGMNGAEFLSYARVAVPDTVRILLTGHASVDNAITAVNDGNVFRFLTKPCAPPDLIRALEDAVEQSRLVTADRMLVERKLEQMSGHLLRAERLASLGTIAGAVGHELQNVLTPFAGALEFIRRDAADDKPPRAEDLETLRQAQEHLMVHARNLLNLGRPAPRDAKETTNLGHAVSAVLGVLRSAGLLWQAQVRLDISSESIVVAAGKVAVEQVLMNIVKNAVEAMAETGQRTPLIQIGIGYTATSDAAVCTVTDNAGGVPEAVLPLLFEPYYTTKPPDRGTGLGLFVVRQIVRDVGGEVTVQSEQGNGTTFTITFPLAETHAEPQGDALLITQA